MAGRISYLGGIVTQGLVLDLDAAKRDSYVGTGTAWNDISGRNANMTLNNGPTYINQGPQSYMLFDGLNDNGTTTVNISDSTTGDKCSFECWCYGPLNNATMLMSWGPSFRYDIFINNNGIGFNTYNSDVYGISSLPLKNTWFHFFANFYRGDSTQCSMFINGTQQTLSYIVSTQISSNANFGGGLMRIGSGGDGYAGNWRFNMVRVYNRNLSASEVLQNYNATRGRFGL